MSGHWVSNASSDETHGFVMDQLRSCEQVQTGHTLHFKHSHGPPRSACYMMTPHMRAEFGTYLQSRFYQIGPNLWKRQS